MPTPPEEETIIGTFADTRAADSAAAAARKAGFTRVEQRSGGVVAIQTDERRYPADEIRAIFAAYGAREYGQTASEGTKKAVNEEQRVRAEAGTTIELVEERLTPHTRSVHTGDITIRKEVVTETRTIEVPVRREELVIEHHPVDRRPADSVGHAPSDPLIQQLLDRLQHMQSGETLRIPIIEEEVVIHKRPVVVEEITVGKRTVQETQKVTDTIRREEARIEEHGEAHVRGKRP